MKSMSRMFLLALPATVAVLAGCAAPAQNQVSYGQGKHLVYRDASGNLIRQFDYPSEDACRRVAAMSAWSSSWRPRSGRIWHSCEAPSRRI